MKVQFIIFLALLASVQVSAQNSLSKFKPSASEQVYAFDPIGNIALSDDHAIVPNRSLSDSCLASFKVVLKEKTPFDFSYINSSKDVNTKNQEYFMRLMQRIEGTDQEILSSARYGTYIKDLIAPYEGRYFCFVLYSGLESPKDKSKLVSTNGGAATDLLFPLGTEKAFLHTYLLIVDKQKGSLAYFKHSKINGSPVRKSTVENQVEELLSLNQ